MKIAIDIDDNQLRKAAENLSQSATLLNDLSADPKQVLGKLGVTIDDDTARRIQQHVSSRVKLRGAPAAAAAAIVHIDT